MMIMGLLHFKRLLKKKMEISYAREEICYSEEWDMIVGHISITSEDKWFKMSV